MPYPQTFKGIQDVVLAKLRLRDNTTNRDLVKDWINQSYAQAAEETQALREAGYSLLVPGGADPDTYLLPERIIELKWVIISPANGGGFGGPLELVSMDEMLRLRQNGQNGTGSPSRYALFGQKELELWPTPTQADRIQFYYSYLPDALAADGDIPEFQEPWGSKILEYGALAQAAEMQADPLGPTWDAKYQDWKTRLKVHMSRRGGMSDQFPLGRRPWPGDRSADICYGRPW